jgi:hypothetical protein
VRFAIESWDWKDQIDFDHVNDVIKTINQPVHFTDISFGGDSYVVAIHTMDSTLSEDDWEIVALAVLEEFDDLPDDLIHPPNWTLQGDVYDATPEDIRDYILSYMAATATSDTEGRNGTQT